MEQTFSRIRVKFGKVVEKFHHFGNGRIEGKAFEIGSHSGDESVVENARLSIVFLCDFFGNKKVEKSVQKAPAAHERFHLPHFFLVKRGHEEHIESERIGPDLIDDFIGGNAVE